jgi:hypothetical protein
MHKNTEQRESKEVSRWMTHHPKHMIAYTASQLINYDFLAIISDYSITKLRVKGVKWCLFIFASIRHMLPNLSNKECSKDVKNASES